MKCRQGIVEEDEGLSICQIRWSVRKSFSGDEQGDVFGTISSALVLGVAREEGLAPFSRPREFVTNGTLTTDRPWSAPLALSPGCARWTWPSSPSAPQAAPLPRATPRALLDSSALSNAAIRSWTGHGVRVAHGPGAAPGCQHLVFAPPSARL